MLASGMGEGAFVREGVFADVQGSQEHTSLFYGPGAQENLHLANIHVVGQQPAFALDLAITPASIAPQGQAQATVTLREDGNPKANATVSFQAQALPGSGGHDHDAARPVGAFSASSCTTGSDGVCSVTYTASVFSGIETVIASAAGAPQQSQDLIVSVPGLALLADSTFYTKVGGTVFHLGPPLSIQDHNHYGLQGFNQVIIDLSFHYASRFPGHQLRINDMSLPNGGLFDMNGDWQRPHKFHRLGISCDINTLTGLNQQVNTLEETFLFSLISRLNLLAHREASHWHIYLPGGGP
ncbi:MAG: Ig-like domain-containing protein [Elusimicrobiota bacterium]